MDGFRTVKRAGHQGQRRRPRHRSGADARTGRRRRNGQRHFRGAPHPGVVRRAVVRDLDDPDREPAGASPRAASPRFTSLTPGVIAGGASAGGTRLGGVGQNNIMMDGISAMDTGNNGHDAQHERRVDCRSQGADPGLPGGVRTVERHPDHGRHEVRHEPLPRIGLRLQDQLRLEREQLVYDIRSLHWNENVGQRRTATPSRSTSATSTATPSAVRSASPAATTSCSSSTRTSTARPTRRSTTATRSGTASRPRSSAPATSRRRSTTTARCSPTSGTRSSGFDCSAAEHGGLLPGRRRPRPDPAEPPEPGEPRAPLALPDADHAAGARHELQLRQLTPPSVEDLKQQPAIRLDYQLSSKLRFTGKYSGQRARGLTTPGLIQGFTDVAQSHTRSSPTTRSPSTTRSARRPSSKARTASSATSWWAATRAASWSTSRRTG